MKHIKLAIVLSIFSFNLFCQQEEIVVQNSARTYFWDSGTKKWIYHILYENRYDTKGDVIEYYKSWEGARHHGFTYDSHGNLTMGIYSSGLYNDTIRYSNTYDTEGYLTERIQYHLRPETNEYIGMDHDDYTYDDNGNLIEIVSYNWDSDIKDWYLTWRTIYYWSPLSTDISNSKNDQSFLVYPNPTNKLLRIESEYPDHFSIQITSLNGQLIHSTKMEGTSHQIDLSSFQKGVYFITIMTKDFVTTETIIKL